MRRSPVRPLASALLFVSAFILVACTEFSLSDLNGLGLRDENSPEGQRPEVQTALDAPEALKALSRADKAIDEALASTDARTKDAKFREATLERPFDYEYELEWYLDFYAQSRGPDGNSHVRQAMREFRALRPVETIEESNAALQLTLFRLEIRVFNKKVNASLASEAAVLRRLICEDLEEWPSYKTILPAKDIAALKC